ncbi:MAG TPA: sialidase family protein [Actinomycetota bacterium]|jgi:hypothetical protein
MRRLISLASVMATIVALLSLNMGTASARIKPNWERFEEKYEDLALSERNTPGNPAFQGIGITECPHARDVGERPKPIDHIKFDKVAQLSSVGDDIRVNQDYTCLPQNETSIAVNPTIPSNVVGGQNDYQLGWGSSGFDSSTDGGRLWHNRLRAFPTAGTPLLSPALLSDDHIDGGGDPVIAFDRDGFVYYADIHFERERDDNGVFVSRSTNGGFTWSRPCVSRTQNPTTCGAAGDPRVPGDGVVTFQEDVDGTGPAPAPAFEDKEWMTTGKRPAGVTPVCFDPTHAVMTCPVGRRIGVDRIYVTWTRFTAGTAPAEIMISYSDDQARSWSPAVAISGSAAFCLALACNMNQFSNPTVNPHTGELWVGFENFNTNAENQYLVVRSDDGGQTFSPPFFVSFIYDINYPVSGAERPDCEDRGQAATEVLTNTCFRIPTAANIVADKRDGGFADDLYVTFEDNRNGTPQSTNADIWFFRSTDGGETWIGPTRVNNDASASPADRNCSAGDTCPPSEGPDAVNTGNDQYFPWIDVGRTGFVHLGFYDRRLDTKSTLTEWPDSRSRKGNYLSWYFGAVCQITNTARVHNTVANELEGTKPADLPAGARQCVSPNATVLHTPTLTPEEPAAEDFGGKKFLDNFKNFTISDVPSNSDYNFRAGIFQGDYTQVTTAPDGETAYALWADMRNGRGSGGPGGTTNPPPSQPGRNPSCEQADAFLDKYDLDEPGGVFSPPSQTVIDLFSVTPCPKGAVERGDDEEHDHDDD